MGNGVGVDFGKSAQKDQGSTNLFLDDGFGKGSDDDFGTRVSPGIFWLLR